MDDVQYLENQHKQFTSQVPNAEFGLEVFFVTLHRHCHCLGNVPFQFYSQGLSGSTLGFQASWGLQIWCLRPNLNNNISELKLSGPLQTPFTSQPDHLEIVLQCKMTGHYKRAFNERDQRETKLRNKKGSPGTKLGNKSMSLEQNQETKSWVRGLFNILVSFRLFDKSWVRGLSNKLVSFRFFENYRYDNSST